MAFRPVIAWLKVRVNWVVGLSAVTLLNITLTWAAVTVTVAVPLLVESTVELALTVKLVAVSLAATVKRPPVLMVVPITPSTVQVTV